MRLGRFSRIKGGRFVFLVFGLVGVLGLCAYARSLAEDDGGPAVLRSRAFRLKHLSNAEAKAQLETLRIGTDVDVLPHNSLIVTAKDVNDLIKASSLLKLADSPDKYKIEVIAEWPGAAMLPSSGQIANRGGLANVGTLLDPPASGIAGGVIIDVHRGKIVAAAPSAIFDRVKGTFAAMVGAPVAGETPATAEAAPSTLQEAAPARLRMGPAFPPTADAAMLEKPLQDELPRTLAGVEEAPAPAIAVADVAASEKSFQTELLRTLTETEKAQEKTADAPRKAGLLGGWGLAAASAAVPTPIAAPRPAPLAAEVDVAALAKNSEPNAIKRETSAEGAAAESEAGKEGVMEGAAAGNDGAVEAADEKGAAGTEAAEEPAAPEEKPAETATAGETADDGAGSENAENDPMLEIIRKLQESAAAEEAAADPNKTEETPAAEAGTATEATEATAAPPVRPTPVRPALPAPKAPSGSLATPRTTEAPAKIETSAADGAAQDAVAPGEKELQTVIVLPEKVDILALIEMVGKQLGLNYMFDPKQVSGEVMLKIHDGKIKVKDMYALLESVLRFKNLAMTRRGNLVTIMPIGEASNYDPVLWRDGANLPEAGQVVVTTIYQLKSIDTTTAQQMLTNMKLGITFNAIEDTQTLIVTDYAYRMGRIEEILKLVDVKGKARRFISRKLEYVLPSEMATKVLAIAQQMGTISVTVSQEVTTAPVAPMPPAAPGTPQPGRAVPTVRPPTPVRMPMPAGKTGSDTGVYLDTDDRTNRILIVGIEEDIETVNMIIDSLDVERYGLKTVKEYPMQYVEATDVLETLYELGVISSQPTSRTSALPSRMGATTRTATTTPTTMRTPVTTPMGTYTPGGAAPAAGEPQISVRMSTNSLLVNATAEHHREIEMLIRFVDVEQQDVRTVHEYEIQYVELTEVVDTLTELGIIAPQSASSASQSARRAGTTQSPYTSRIPTQAGVAAPGAPNPQEEAPTTTTFEATTGAEITSDQPQIAVLESTNSLLVYATPKQHETISLVVAHVDRELTATSTPYVVYALENQDPEELAATLNEIIQATVSTTAKSPESKIQTGAPGSATAAAAGSAVPPKREKNEIQIVPDPKSYSLIVYADKKNQQWVSDLIEELDQYRPQVHLDVTLVEITKDDQFTFDLDLVTKLPEFVAAGTMTKLPPLVTPFSSGQIAEGTSTFGTGSAFFSDKHVQALLNLVDRKKYGRVLARPSLLVKDNQPGEIKAEKTIYIELQKTTTVPTSPTNSVPITDVTFEPYTSGVTLSITPHIASEKILQLEITLDRTDFVEGTGITSDGGDKPLDTVSSNLGTWAVLPNGATIILGGIETIDQSKLTRKVPLLGDIPIIGGLFRGVDNTDVQSRLYVFVKATIIRPGEELTGESDIEKLSKRKREAFERDEARFQGLDGVFPGQKQPSVEPERILEDDEYITRLKGKKEEEAVSVEVNLDAPLQSSPSDMDDAY
jgi:type II secretory pathway component GspD/PulD (secretin)